MLGTNPIAVMTVYIAGPMRGYPDDNRSAFYAAERYIRERAEAFFSPETREKHSLYVVLPKIINPAREDQASGRRPGSFTQKDFQDAIRQDVRKIVRDVDIMYVLPGWEFSQGAYLEVHLAQTLGVFMVWAPGANSHSSVWVARDIKPPPTPKTQAPKPENDGECLAARAVAGVYGAKRKAYGHPFDDFSRTAALWTAIHRDHLTRAFTPEDVAKFMICVKMAREQNAHMDDNIVDIIGYAMALADVIQRERSPQQANRAGSESGAEGGECRR